MMNAHDIYERTSFDAALAFPFDECETRSDPVGPLWKPDIVTALIATQGNIGKAARLVGRKRGTLQRFIDKHMDIQEVLIDMREHRVDVVEDAQFALAEGGDGAAGRFILQTLGKDRGYVARSETTGKNGGPIESAHLDVPLENLPADKQAELLSKYLGEAAARTIQGS